MNLRNTLRTILAGALAAAFVMSCNSYKRAEERLSPPKSTQEVRIADIEQAVEDDPAKAIRLTGVYYVIYGNDGDTAKTVNGLREQAIGRLKEMQTQAITAKRWDDAASLARSLAALDITVKNTGAEPDFLLAEAKEHLQNDKNLNAFLFAFRSNELSRHSLDNSASKGLSADDALLFLERAVEQKQRGTAAYFLKAAQNAGAVIPSEYAAYAQRKDNPQEMIKGVATVLIDRGIKIERGMGMPDRVLGSAFFIDSSGLLITNYHVISSEVDPTYNGYSRMYIRTGDSSSARVPAAVVGWDKTLDLALIKTKTDVAKPGYVFSVIDHALPQVGDTVLAIGSPGGLEKTVTSGIVSALGRRFLQIGDVIQIDAAVNHGNSGGPVVDMQGRLVGIVFAGVEQFQGLNFAVPAERLAAALPALIKGGKASRPWLGLTIAETPRGEAEVIYVAPRTPASEQRLTEGLYIEALNGQKINVPQGSLIPALQDRLFSCRPGELFALKTSDGITRVLQLAERPLVPLAEAAKLDSRERMTAPLFGLMLEPSVAGSLTPSYLIKKVVRGSVADEAGLSAQDPVSIHGFRVEEKNGFALLDINVKKRRAGYFETMMRLPAALDSPDTL
ncbi:MAG: S1C family serine protease [Spirochaetaceae bacterium]|jgi:S1-C subfamily serine protease|nr:S1C family serine protease [Spirochaetaceae bacterium]